MVGGVSIAPGLTPSCYGNVVVSLVQRKVVAIDPALLAASVPGISAPGSSPTSSGTAGAAAGSTEQSEDAVSSMGKTLGCGGGKGGRTTPS